MNSSPRTHCLLSVNYRHNDDILFYRYFIGYCSSEPANCMPPLHLRPLCTRLSNDANHSNHPESVHLIYGKVNQILHSFMFFFNGKTLTLSVCFNFFFLLKNWAAYFKKDSSKIRVHFSITYYLLSLYNPASNIMFIFIDVFFRTCSFSLK